MLLTTRPCKTRKSCEYNFHAIGCSHENDSPSENGSTNCLCGFSFDEELLQKHTYVNF